MILESSFGKVSFRKVLKIRLFISIVIFLGGLKSLLIVLLNQVENLQSLTSKFGIHLVNFEFMKSFYTGFGFVLIALSVNRIVKNLRLLKNINKFKNAEIKHLDERSRFISNTTFSITSQIFVAILTLAVVISGMFNSIVFLTLLCTLIVYLKFLLITYLIVRTKY